MKTILQIILFVSSIPLVIFADDNGATVNKNITVIQGQSNADGKSDVSERILEECIVSLPKAGELDPIIGSNTLFLKEINGDPAKNAHTMTYTASLDINYMLYQKTLVIVTTNSVQGQEPVMKVMEKNLKQVKRFTSNSSNGDLFAGRSHRQYFFSSPEAAKSDVIKQASSWIKQQSAVQCNR